MAQHFYLLSLLLFSLLGPVQASPQLEDVEAWMQAGQYQQALSQLDTWLTQDKHNAHYLFSRARALAGTGQLKMAIEQYRALIRRHPDLPEPYNNLAVIYMQQGKYAEAQTLLTKAMATHPGYARVYKNLTAVNTARAREAYAKALQMPAESPLAGLAVADRLTLPERPAAVVKPAPVAKPAVKPSMVYQASKPHADKNSVAAGKKPPPAAAEVEAAKAVLQDWAKAWSTKSVDQYLHFYSDDYAPAGMTHQDWVSQRRVRINRPRWIRVTLQHLQVTAAGPQRLRVRLEQEYAADNYRDVTRKEFVLQKAAGRWRIIQERGLGYATR